MQNKYFSPSRPLAVKPRKPKPAPTPEQIERAQNAAWDAIQAAIYLAINALPRVTENTTRHSALALQFVAVNATANNFPNCDKVAALAAAVEHGTAKQCKTLLAAAFIGWSENAQLFKVPSIGHIGDHRRVRYFGPNHIECPCEASGECWHIKAVRNVIALGSAPAAAPVSAYPNDDDDLHDAPRVAGYRSELHKPSRVPHIRREFLAAQAKQPLVDYVGMFEE